MSRQKALSACPYFAPQNGKLAFGSALAHLVDVVIPSPDIREGHLDAHIRLDQLRDLPQAVAKASTYDGSQAGDGVLDTNPSTPIEG